MANKQRSNELKFLYLELMRRRAKSDLCFLMEEVLGYAGLAPVHKEVEDQLRKVELGKRKGLFLLPRGHLKSTEITISYTMQKVINNPNTRVLITNALLDNSKGFLREIKSHFEKNEKLRGLFGDFTNSDEKWSESQIVVKPRTSFLKEPTIQATSVDKSVVSQHYDIIIADDLVTRDSISTKEQRQKLIKYYKDLLDLLEPDGTLLIIGTRWHYDDLYGWLISENVNKGNFEVLVKQVWIDEKKEIALFPQKFKPAYIRSLRDEKGTYEFNCQYNNDPVNDESADFKKEWFKYFSLNAGIPIGEVYITIDPAVSKQDTADYTGIVVNCVEGGRWKILEAYQVKLNATELVDEMFFLYRKYRPMFCKMGLEDIMYTSALEYDITRRMRETNEWFTIEKLKHKNRKKEMRIRSLVPLFERGNIELSDKCVDLEDELTHFPASEHDDIMDALAYQLDIVNAQKHFTAATSFKKGDYVIEPIHQEY